MSKKLNTISEKINTNLINREVTIIADSGFSFPIIRKGFVIKSTMEKYERRNALCIHMFVDGKDTKVTATNLEDLYLYEGIIELDPTTENAIKSWKAFKPSESKPYFKFDENVVRVTAEKTKVKPYITLKSNSK